MTPEFIRPDWPAPPNVHALVTTRQGEGLSLGPYARFNVGYHFGDDPAAVSENRRRLRTHLPTEPVWLKQVHGDRCIDAATAATGCEADAAFTRSPDVVCAVLTADCLPVLLCDRAGTTVAIAHAGWRGLAAGIIENTIRTMGLSADQLIAWLGPAIGPRQFEVGPDVRAAFLSHAVAADSAFVPQSNGKWLCDIYQLARQRLAAAGVSDISGGNFCTVSEPERFYSYRRDRITGHMASLIWRT